MSDKRLLIVDAEVARKIEENRGDMSRSDFINLLIESSLKEDHENPNYATKEEFAQFQQGTRELLRNFLDFFVSYGLELGKQPQDKTFNEMNQKLQELGNLPARLKTRD